MVPKRFFSQLFVELLFRHYLASKATCLSCAINDQATSHLGSFLGLSTAVLLFLVPYIPFGQFRLLLLQIYHGHTLEKGMQVAESLEDCGRKCGNEDDEQGICRIRAVLDCISWLGMA